MYNALKSVYRKAFITDHPLMLAIGNLRQPRRFIQLAMHDQIVGKIPLLSRTRPMVPPTGPIDGALIEKAYADIREKGIAIFPGLLADKARELRARYMRADSEYDEFDRYDRIFFNPTSNELISSIVLNETFLALAGKFLGCQPYLRLGPSLAVLKPEHTTIPKYGVPHGLEQSGWHIDTPTLFGFHLIVNDTRPGDTRMRYAMGSQTVRRSSSGLRSEESIESRYPVLDCYGPAGTVYIFDHNGLHRAHGVKGSLRSTFEFYYTAGNSCFSIEMMRWAFEIDKLRGKPDRQHLGDGMMDPIRLNDAMTPLQRETLRAMMEKKKWKESAQSRARGKNADKAPSMT